MRDIDSAALKAYCQRLRIEDYPEATVQKHVRHLRAVFNWACVEGLLTEVPQRPLQPPDRRGQAMKANGRPLNADKLKLYTDAISKVCSGTRESQVRRLVDGILLTGFRLGDAMRATWDQTGEVHPLFRDGQQPVWVFSDAQKNRRSEEVAMVPGCVDFLAQTPEGERAGWIFPLDGVAGRLTENAVSKILSAIGKASGVAVTPPDPRTGEPKYASAHDLRRTFGQRMAYEESPAVLKHLMRHRSHLTTDRYYLGADAQEVAAHLSRRRA
jgi:integrase